MPDTNHAETRAATLATGSVDRPLAVASAGPVAAAAPGSPAHELEDVTDADATTEESEPEADAPAPAR